MNKLSKIAILFGISLICISILISSFNFKNLFSPFYNNSSYETIEYYAKDIEKLVLDTSNDDINITYYDGDLIKITYSEDDDVKYSVKEVNGLLTINKSIKFHFINFHFNFYIPGIKIEVPYDYAINYDINTSNGKIDINGISLLDSKFKSSNGKISLKNIHCDAKVDFVTSNGSLSLDYVDLTRIYGKTSNGKIELNNVNADKIELKSSNGRVEFSNLISPIIDIKTSNGKVIGTINAHASDYQKTIKTSNGTIEINGYEYGNVIRDDTNLSNKLIIKTSNASVNIDFE